MEKSKGKSKRARHLRKQLELVALCRNADTTDMRAYLSVLVVLIEALNATRYCHSFLFLFAITLSFSKFSIFNNTNNLTKLFLKTVYFLEKTEKIRQNNNNGFNINSISSRIVRANKNTNLYSANCKTTIQHTIFFRLIYLAVYLQ